ncbi:hypothetical protein A2276_04660 [candidate division WOR-1 bacterium RIFOXYA12_FULL_43_27]|uniref:Response regulatory domain-containing protein n=1 Tax=candidate division WOR-1 bacterium RIFOXYC2_FULL_46_14 TaxID=1802587 RepID=A0A1F4U320_UNCSA|nr:MAG: hypothetical protein A2276_04660 [candidate division WOR-1 bacterium RIFOXYA12_FULL_43_27]OGC18884.1 MAG: hypothetical protein A2292_08175 [candidate division WOR-1 bacterium RIFOXYB2_FULL_46_45]OGC29025.1 MAG: hypothetical protein A2232_03240 [candidate division WOR-1 bacterium RIFOXYA2_FULL_46_56]OGC39281.1 MAG: hypothetical protein A2438_07140 [candidate division WOR-1 bacterium RIFOXYC2_FULL_46_14]
MSVKANVLVIDDETSILEAFKMTLKYKDYGVEVFADGHSALANFQKDKYDVAFIDLKLPDQIDGIEILREMKKTDPRLQVIIMTAYDTKASETTARKLGVIEYLRKPFLMEEIYELVERGLKLREDNK